MKKGHTEFIAVRTGNNSFECALPSETFYTSESVDDTHIKENFSAGGDYETSINNIFFESYHSNFILHNNDLLKKAQQSLMDMQETLLASLHNSE